MWMKRIAVVLLLIAVLCSTLLIMDTDRARVLSYRIEWEGNAREDRNAIQIGDEWYIPTDVLAQAYGIQVQARGSELQLSTTANGKSHWNYKPIHYRDEVITVMYHNIEKNPSHVTFISPYQLEDQLQHMLNDNFHFITMEQYINFMLHGGAVPPNAVLLTFDDGYESFYSEVYPILLKYRLTAANFVIVSSIDNRKQIGHPKLSWAQMREMKQHGMSFYSHTYDSHAYASIDQRGKQRPMLTHQLYLAKERRLETDQEYITRIKHDLGKAELRLKEMLGNERSVLAFPYGAYNQDVLKVCKELGIDLTFTVKPGINQRTRPNGFRINAGNQQIHSADLIEQMRNRGLRTKLSRAKSPNVVKWNGTALGFERTPVVKNGQWYLPLGELENFFGLGYQIDSSLQRVRLFTET
ncbi:polysaccharide deacetylase family protein [Paenibacillus apiarius]|uniref:polysaccharide deacetylase family protein n=1 Tax=Paenibacillus apiarius TaxID=46240 RepID=UPI003B3AECA9